MSFSPICITINVSVVGGRCEPTTRVRVNVVRLRFGHGSGLNGSRNHS